MFQLTLILFPSYWALLPYFRKYKGSFSIGFLMFCLTFAYSSQTMETYKAAAEEVAERMEKQLMEKKDEFSA